MATVFHTSHTALMRKVHGRNLGTFIAGSPALVEKTSEFSAAGFARIPDGHFMRVTFRVSGDRRYFVGADDLTAYNGKTLEEAARIFWYESKGELIKQAVRHYRRTPRTSIPESIPLVARPGSPVRVYASLNKDAVLRLRDNTVDFENIALFEAESERFITYQGVLAEEGSKEADAPEVGPKSKRPSRMRNINAMVEIGGIVAKAADWHLFEAMKAVAEAQTAANILLVGPSGCGKTSMPEAFARQNGMNFLRMNCATIRDPEEWIGYREARDGSTVFVKSEFIKAVEAGNTMIVLDEFNRVEPWLHNTLFPLLDHDRRTTAHNEQVVVGKGTIFAATANIGGKFTGTFVLDAALTNRFDATIQMGYLAEDQEAKVICGRTSIDCGDASKIVAVVRTLRGVEKQLELGIDLSIRTSLKVATVWKHSNLPMMAIVDRVILSAVQDDSVMKKLIDAVTPVIKNLFEE